MTRGNFIVTGQRCSTDEQDLTAQRLAEQDPDPDLTAALRGRPRRRRPALGTYPAGRKGAPSIAA